MGAYYNLPRDLVNKLYRVIMKLEICNYSGYKIYPGHGKRVCKIDGKVHIYLNSKCQRAITGVTWNEILAKRNQQPEFRKAQRQDAINAAKQAKKAKAQQKKVAQPAGLKTGKPVKKPEKIQKNVPKAGPKKGTQR